MHPKQICQDIESMGAKLVLEGEDLFIEQPENVYPEMMDFIKGYKSRIIKFLKGEFSDQEHNVKQTIDKIVDFYRDGCRVDTKINQWLQVDDGSLKLIMQLVVMFSDNGWSLGEPVCNYESKETDRLSKEIYDRAMFFFRKGVVQN